MKYIPLVQVCDFQGGSQPPKDQWIDHEKEGYIRMLQIRDFTQPDKDNVEFVRISKTIKTCNEDDILIGRYGASVGKILTGLAGAYNVAIIKTIPDTSKLSKRFLYHYLNSPYFQNFILSVGSRAAQAGFNKDDLSDAQIPDLSLEEQSNVVSQLDKVTELITLRKEQLAKLDQLVKSRFIELFGDIASCPKYDGVTLGTICTTLSGGTPTTKVPEYYAGDIPWISTPYLGNNHINGSSAKAYITEEAIKNSATHLIPANTIMFGIRVGVGKSSIIDEPMCANQDIVALMGIDTSKYNLLFVKHVLDAYQSHFDSIKKGATILGITTEDLKKVLVPTVDVEIQNQFADFVEQVDKSKLAIQQSLDKLELLKKSLMQEYFG